jgi:hypothetical protein
MKMKIKEIKALTTCFLLSGCLISCQDSWDAHYSETVVESEGFTVYSGDVESYIKEQPDLTLIASILDEQGMFESTSKSKGYTFIVCDNEVLSGGLSVPDSVFAKNCVSDISIAPSKLTEGLGIYTRLGKNIWVYNKNDSLYLDDYKLIKKVKAQNGYIYYVDGQIPIRQSVYEMLKNLGSDYSEFVALIEKYEESYFDKENSTPSGVDGMGNTIYSDSIISVRNTLMDRYTEDGLKTWDMRSEDYVTTLFIPNNKMVEECIQSALDSVPKWLGRTATTSDQTKFEKWIVRACFVNRRLSDAEVSTGGADFDCVGGYVQEIDETLDKTDYESIDPARWRPSVQKVDLSSKVKLSNGEAFFLNNLRIPNHIVIWRAKAKFYQVWNAMTSTQKTQYFRWTNWIDPLIINDAQGEFTLSETLPTMHYHVLAAIPSATAIADSLVCSVTYDGVLFNPTTEKISEVYLPAGEYYLRMGFKHSLRYSINILFNDSLVVKHMMLYAQGSNFHFDRGSVSTLDYYGSTAVGYPEDYNWKDWIEVNEKAAAYDTDGWEVAIVNLHKSGNFTITIQSEDDSYYYSSVNARTKNNVTQLMMYHWCLRPTLNNY